MDVFVLYRNNNGEGSGWVAPIPTLSRLFETILIPVLFKKLNGAGWCGQVCYIPIPAPFIFNVKSKTLLTS